MGTIGGASAEADPSGDWGAVLLTLETLVRSFGPQGERTVTLGDKETCKDARIVLGCVGLMAIRAREATFNGAKGMGEGGAAPVHTISAALQDALYANGVIIEESHNNGDSIYRALKRAQIGEFTTLVRVERSRLSR
ncbi:MAG: FAD binding domain-containing protein [Acidobacteriia bacterium]|nr:FAD binding domain-containing protein [Terriglobia bacterium]